MIAPIFQTKVNCFHQEAKNHEIAESDSAVELTILKTKPASPKAGRKM
jgi:hypothetical protein